MSGNLCQLLALKLLCFQHTVSLSLSRQESGMSSIFIQVMERLVMRLKDLFGTIAIGANEQEGCLSLAGSHLNMWSSSACW